MISVCFSISTYGCNLGWSNVCFIVFLPSWNVAWSSHSSLSSVCESLFTNGNFYSEISSTFKVPSQTSFVSLFQLLSHTFTTHLCLYWPWQCCIYKMRIITDFEKSQLTVKRKEQIYQELLLYCPQVKLLCHWPHTTLNLLLVSSFKLPRLPWKG